MTDYSKDFQEALLKWTLVFALLRIRITPRVKEGVSPFEFIYGKSYPTNLLNIKGNKMYIKGQAAIKKYLIFLLQTLSLLHTYLNKKVSLPLNSQVHPFFPGVTFIYGPGKMNH